MRRRRWRRKKNKKRARVVCFGVCDGGQGQPDRSARRCGRTKRRAARAHRFSRSESQRWRHSPDERRRDGPVRGVTVAHAPRFASLRRPFSALRHCLERRRRPLFSLFGSGHVRRVVVVVCCVYTTILLRTCVCVSLHADILFVIETKKNNNK